MIEPVFIGNDADMRETAEENQVAKLELVALWRRAEGRPIRTRGTALEIQTYVLIRTPDKARAIKGVRTGAGIVIRRSQMRLHRRQQELIEATGYYICTDRSRPAFFD